MGTCKLTNTGVLCERAHTCVCVGGCITPVTAGRVCGSPVVVLAVVVVMVVAAVAVCWTLGLLANMPHDTGTLTQE
jgi:hypothetical protein